jgi:protein involved in polysaccharide export with SLBB domain
MEQILRARITTGDYRTVVGDVLQIETPRIMDPESADKSGAGNKESHVCRIGRDGRIVLPMVGPFDAAGKTLDQIEVEALALYYPKYVKEQFPVYVSVLEYHTRKVSVAGAVAKPGVYALKPDQMSLVALLMEAGGIVEKGAAVIRIARGDGSARTFGERAPVSLESANGHGTGTGRITMSRLQAAERAGRPLDNTALRATFKREGPLCATGWLAVAGPGGVQVNTWLDLASESQRSTFLDRVAGEMRREPDPRLRARLVDLANALQSAPPGRWVDGLSEWQVAEDGRCMTVVDARFVTSQPESGEIVLAKAAPMANDEAVETIVLPVKGLNIPFADVALQEGDSVVVEGAREKLISVLGLVKSPGNFPYPPNAEYNLAQAVAFAGGLDMIADPRYVSVYRLKPSGEIASVTVQLVNPKANPHLTEAMATPLRPGDVVSIEHTARTRTNVLLDRILRVNLGLYVNPETIWNQ